MPEKHHKSFFRSTWSAYAPCRGHSGQVTIAANHDDRCTMHAANALQPQATRDQVKHGKYHLTPCAVLLVVGALVGRVKVPV